MTEGRVDIHSNNASILIKGPNWGDAEFYGNGY